ncbi:MAG: calcium-binding protein, partial [Actinomycetota bacterium]|nr:calcium-binding protein [Actinomycetota bacterium]
NNSGSGGGIGGEDGGSYLAKGTLIDGNLGVAGATDCDATVVSLGHNFIGNPTGCATFDHPSDDGGTPALLGPLADNGGRTLTMKPAAGSPVIDAGGNDCPPADQRGRPRPRGEACDVGAVEAR